MTRDALEKRYTALRSEFAEVTAERTRLAAERERYRQLYLEMLEKNRALEKGLVGQKTERMSTSEQQLSFQLLAQLLGETPTDDAAPDDEPPKRERTGSASGVSRRKPARKPLPENLPRVIIEVLPPEVQREGLDAFDRIGQEVSEVIERRPASAVVVCTVRPKFVRRDKRAGAAPFAIAEPLELPIPRSVAGPGMLADSIVRR
jgi:transposase